MADDSKDRAVDSVEAYEPEIKVINPTLTYVKVGGRILKLREMNNKKVKLLLEMIAEVMEEVFGGKISINIKTAEDFMKFINEVPERKINEFIKFVFATKDDPEPVNDEFISEYFTPRLVQACPGPTPIRRPLTPQSISSSDAS